MECSRRGNSKKIQVKILRYYNSLDYSPTHREVSNHFRFPTHSAATYHINKLVEDGHLYRGFDGSVYAVDNSINLKKKCENLQIKNRKLVLENKNLKKELFRLYNKVVPEVPGILELERSEGVSKVNIEKCHFCKRDDVRIWTFHRGGNEGNNEYECVVECNGCQATGPMALNTNEDKAKEIAIKFWNGLCYDANLAA